MLILWDADWNRCLHWWFLTHMRSPHNKIPFLSSLFREVQLCYWSTWPVAWPALSQWPPTWTSHHSTTSSWRAATAATSSTSPRGRAPRSTSLIPTAPRRNPQSTFRAPLNLCAWHGSTSWYLSSVCVSFDFQWLKGIMLNCYAGLFQHCFCG